MTAMTSGQASEDSRYSDLQDDKYQRASSAQADGPPRWTGPEQNRSLPHEVALSRTWSSSCFSKSDCTDTYSLRVQAPLPRPSRHCNPLPRAIDTEGKAARLLGWKCEDRSRMRHGESLTYLRARHPSFKQYGGGGLRSTASAKHLHRNLAEALRIESSHECEVFLTLFNKENRPHSHLCPAVRHKHTGW